MHSAFFYNPPPAGQPIKRNNQWQSTQRNQQSGNHNRYTNAFNQQHYQVSPTQILTHQSSQHHSNQYRLNHTAKYKSFQEPSVEQWIQPRTNMKSYKFASLNKQHQEPFTQLATDEFNIARKQFTIIKSLHHSTSLQQSTPKTWRNWGSNIVSNLRLAFSSEETTQSIKTISNNCIEQLVKASVDHYDKVLSESLSFLSKNSSSVNQQQFNAAFDVAKQWAKRQLGNKLKDSTLAQAVSLINPCFTDTPQSFTNLSISVNNHGRKVSEPKQNHDKTNKFVSSNLNNNPFKVTIPNCKFFINSASQTETTGTVENFSNTPTETDALKSNESDPSEQNERNSQPVSSPRSCNTSKKTIKPNNNNRFFIHSVTQDDVDVEEIMLTITKDADCDEAKTNNIQQDTSKSNGVTKNQMPETSPQVTSENQTNFISQSSQGSLSQTSISSFIHGGPPPTTGNIVHKLSSEQMAISINNTESETVLIGDENWKNFNACDDLSIFIFSGKLSSFRSLFEKTKHNINIKKLIICISSNNCSAPTALTCLSNIYKGLDKFKCKVFVCLAGVCNSLNDSDKSSLETINNHFREKSNKFILVNPPDNFNTTNGHSFTETTRDNFYSRLSSFLA